MISTHAFTAVDQLSALPRDASTAERETIVQQAIDAALQASGFGRSACGLTYQLLHGEEGSGTYGAYGFRIAVAHKGLPNLDARRDLDNETVEEKAFHHAGYDVADGLKGAIMTYVISRDPKAQAARVAERAQIVGLFPAGCYVEEIPNGYDSGWSQKHLPWFVVTTSVGRITIGWRRRVIAIDWSETCGTKTSGELFPTEDVTKDKTSIHAWSIDKARAYVAAIIGSATA